MIMASTELTQYLKGLFPEIKFYTGAINVEEMCVGVYARGNTPSEIALGGVENTSSGTLPITLLVHWTESTAECESTANSIYEGLLGKRDFMIGDRRIISMNLTDSSPINVGRDERNIVEMTIRLNIIYER